MKIKKVNELNNIDPFNEEDWDEQDIDNTLCWDEQDMDGIIKFLEEENERLENEIESSPYPQNVENEINNNQACIWLLRDMKDKKSWMYKHFKK